MYGVTVEEGSGAGSGVAEGPAGMTQVLDSGVGGRTYPPVAGGAGGAVQDPVP